MNTTLHTHKIAFLGAGNMAGAIMKGLIEQGFPRENLSASTSRSESAKQIERRFGINATNDNLEALKGASIVVLAVKPATMKTVCIELAGHVQTRQLIISLAAGIKIAALQRWLAGDQLAIIRCMPNTPAALGLAASGLYANDATKDGQRQLADELLNCVGNTIWVDKESLIDSVTAVSGSGPAYFFLMIEAIIHAGTKQGLSQEEARALAVQTALGAATMAATSKQSVTSLRQQVTSAKGTTERALAVLNEGGYSELIDKAIAACRERAEQLSNEFSN